MNRRQFTIQHVLPLLGASMVASQVQALNLDALSNKDAASGLKGALEKGALAAIGTLGVNDGFMGNPKVRIALPGYLNDAAQLMKKFGQGQKVDELMLSMNRAAETAVRAATNNTVSVLVRCSDWQKAWWACRHATPRRHSAHCRSRSFLFTKLTRLFINFPQS